MAAYAARPVSQWLAPDTDDSWPKFLVRSHPPPELFKRTSWYFAFNISHPMLNKFQLNVLRQRVAPTSPTQNCFHPSPHIYFNFRGDNFYFRVLGKTTSRGVAYPTLECTQNWWSIQRNNQSRNAKCIHSSVRTLHLRFVSIRLMRYAILCLTNIHNDPTVGYSQAHKQI